MYPEDQLLPISALQHLLFCPRQCALIHIERLWTENRLTVEGRHLHDKAHEGPDETRTGVRIARGLPLRSLELGLFGVADVVEFHRPHDDPPRAGPPPPPTTPFPVEYKRGRPKAHDADRVQLCAQGLCLQEMLGVKVERGALFYGRTRRREPVTFDDALQAKTCDAAARLHELIESGVTPPARKEPKCKRCSMINLCLPQIAGGTRSARRYLQRAISQADEPA